MDTGGNFSIFNSTGNSQLFCCRSVFILNVLLKLHFWDWRMNSLILKPLGMTVKINALSLIGGKKLYIFLTNPCYFSDCVFICVCVCVFMCGCLFVSDILFVLLWVSLVAQFSCLVTFDSLRPYGLQHARPPCLSPTPGVYSDLCPLSWWCHPTVSSSVVHFSSCLQSFLASESFPMEAKVLEFQLQHQSFQWIFRTDFL